MQSCVSIGLVWKVCRYTSAAPPYFDELDDYVDGGILANNPTAAALTTIREIYSGVGRKIPISMIVSIGTGITPEVELGRTDIHGSQWLHLSETFSRASTLMSIFTTAVSNLVFTEKSLCFLSCLLFIFQLTESENVSRMVKSQCKDRRTTDYYRFSPRLTEEIAMIELDRNKLFRLVITANTDPEVKRDMDRLISRLPKFIEANRLVSTRLALVE